MVDLLLAILFAVMPPCATEDSPDCVWIASDSGNGVGRDVLTIGPLTITR